MNIKYSTVRADPRGEDYDCIQETELEETVGNSVEILLVKMQEFVSRHPNAVVDDAFEELTLCAVNDDGSESYMLVTTYRKR